MDNEQSKDIEMEEEEMANESDVNNTINNSECIKDSIHKQKLNQKNTHSIQITTYDPDCTCFFINNVPKDITVEELRKLMINSSEFDLKSDSFSFIEDDILLFDNDYIRDGNVRLIYSDNDENDFFSIFLILHLIPIFFYFVYSYPIELCLMLYLILILIFGLFLRVKRSMIIKQARAIMNKSLILFKLIFMFFYSMLPFFNADNLDQEEE